MKKTILLALTFIICLLSLTGCQKNNKSQYKLQIKESSWSGWSEDYKPEEKTKEYEIELDKEYKINGGNLTFTITEINKDNIVIKTTEPFMEDDKGSLTTKDREFTIYFEKDKKLTTPTTDQGNIYYLTLIK